MFGIGEKIYNFVLSIKNKMSRSKKPKKDPSYMLFIFGDFVESENLTQELSTQLLTLVSSPFLKFTYGEYGIVFNFRSKEVFSELKEYIDMVLNDITDQYFLMEYDKNFDVKMPKKLKKDFLSIDGEIKKEENKNGTINVEDFKKEINHNIKAISFDFILPLLDPNSLVQEEEKIEIIEPTVDEILDKITETGIESLTEREKEILDNYGKRKDARTNPSG
jgi:hypothetical protein